MSQRLEWKLMVLKNVPHLEQACSGSKNSLSRTEEHKVNITHMGKPELELEERTKPFKDRVFRKQSTYWGMKKYRVYRICKLRYFRDFHYSNGKRARWPPKRSLSSLFRNPKKPGGGNITEIFHKTGGPYLITF